MVCELTDMTKKKRKSNIGDKSKFKNVIVCPDLTKNALVGKKYLLVDHFHVIF